MQEVMVSQTRTVKQVAAKSGGLNPSVIEYELLQASWWSVLLFLVRAVLLA